MPCEQHEYTGLENHLQFD